MSLEAAAHIVDHLRSDFPPAKIGEYAVDLTYTFSAGLTEALPQDNRNSILQRADRALYVAKAEGRNCTKVR
jgi:diguanylate cyclase